LLVLEKELQEITGIKVKYFIFSKCFPSQFSHIFVHTF